MYCPRRYKAYTAVATYRVSLVEILQASVCVGNPRIVVEHEYPHVQFNPARPNHQGTTTTTTSNTQPHTNANTHTKATSHPKKPTLAFRCVKVSRFLPDLFVHTSVAGKLTQNTTVKSCPTKASGTPAPASTARDRASGTSPPSQFIPTHPSLPDDDTDDAMEAS